MKQEIYVSTDIESDGPIPGLYSMLSFGSAAFTKGKKMIATFSANLKRLPRTQQDPDTMKWWSKQSEAWHLCRQNLQDPKVAMKKYVDWVNALPGKPVFVGYPVVFDFSFMNWYLIKFTGSNPFTYVALDIKSYAMAMLKKPFYTVTKKNMPSHWFDRLQKKHIALEDAIEQGLLFCNMLRENIKREVPCKAGRGKKTA